MYVPGEYIPVLFLILVFLTGSSPSSSYTIIVYPLSCNFFMYFSIKWVLNPAFIT
jgi:hypothetical protein